MWWPLSVLVVVSRGYTQALGGAGTFPKARLKGTCQNFGQLIACHFTGENNHANSGDNIAIAGVFFERVC